ncbi:MAG TPA: ThiF family adenylyltransferase, partial [Anaerovoracaceae bacterium]|nr:ThiF family adenylyltransferase [Anaerovoracaceae bacterium]
GLGALGTVSANNLARAGVGSIKLIDRDYVEISNLQRQTLYDEDDIKNEKPKAIAAYDHLIKVNSTIQLEPVISDVNSSNIDRLIKGCDLVLDCTDNFEIRLLLNEACDQYKIPWIYCGAVGSACMTLNILPEITPCFLCFTGDSEKLESSQTCSTVGVLNMVTNIAASVQSAEAVKIILGTEDVRKTLFFMDVWSNTTEYLEIQKNPQCPVCGKHHYTYLGKPLGSHAISLCGRNEIQVVPGKASDIDFERTADKLNRLGDVQYNSFMLKFSDGKIGIKLFKDGRAIVENAKDASHAKSIYTEYFGL